MPVIRTTDDGRAMFWCPGCQQYHGPRVSGDGPPKWEWNGDRDRPTFSPSIRVRWTLTPSDDDVHRILAGEIVRPVDIVCHSFVRDGMIQFLNDCTHKLAGQTVALSDDEKGET